MPIDRTGRYTYQKQRSSWDIVQTQRQLHAQQTEKYLSAAADARAALSSAFSSQITGSADLAARAAVTRIRNAVLARQAARGLDIST